MADNFNGQLQVTDAYSFVFVNKQFLTEIFAEMQRKQSFFSSCQ